VFVEPRDGDASDVWSERALSEAADADALVERAFVDGADGLRAAYDAYGGIVHRYCTKFLDEHGARDATQETFVTAWRRREDFAPDKGSLLSWLLGIARYSAMNQQRSQRRSPVPTDTLPAGGAGRPGVLDLGLDDVVADRLVVAHALSTLPQRMQDAIVACHVEGLTQAEAAQRLDVPLGTLKSDIRRGLQRMREVLGGDDD
jgi:RNA polymerase sigma-70 factor (ECF subfamily)